MGLTIHYTLKSKLNDAEQVEQAVNKMRQLAMDLPFEEVGDIVDLRGKECDFEARRQELQTNEATKNESLFWLLIQARENTRCPWNKRISRDVLPQRASSAFPLGPAPVASRPTSASASTRPKSNGSTRPKTISASRPSRTPRMPG